MKRPAWTAAGVCLVLAWWCAQQPVAPEHPPGEHLRVVSANLFLANRADPKDVAQALLALQPDVLLLLEWTGKNMDRQVLVDGGLGLHVDHPHSRTAGIGLAMSSRVAGAATVLREGGRGPCAMPAAAARILWDGLGVSVLGVHPPPPVPGCGGLTGASLGDYASWVTNGRAQGGPLPLQDGDPVVILGDLNTLPVDPSLSVLRDHGLRDGIVESSWLPSPSWPVLPGWWALGRIDGVWVPPHMDVVDGGTVEVPGSDHRAVWVDLHTRFDPAR